MGSYGDECLELDEPPQQNDTKQTKEEKDDKKRNKAIKIPKDAVTLAKIPGGKIQKWKEKTERGWHIIQVPASDPNQPDSQLIVEINVNGKVLQLVQQKDAAGRVHVNPDIYGPDEWETPPWGRGNVLQIWSPDAPLRPQENAEYSEWLLA